MQPSMASVEDGWIYRVAFASHVCANLLPRSFPLTILAWLGCVMTLAMLAAKASRSGVRLGPSFVYTMLMTTCVIGRQKMASAVARV